MGEVGDARMFDRDVPDLTGVPEGVPRRNGELAFDAPWESRAFGLAAADVEATGCGWARFRRHLVTAVADAPADTPYYESWLAALGSLLAALPLPDASTGDAAEVVHRADAALYRAKRQRRRVVES